MTDSRFNQYIGVPYKPKGRTVEGCDCWGLVRLVLKEEFGIDLPSYDTEYAGTSMRHNRDLARLVDMKKGILDVDEVEVPIAGDIVLLKLDGFESHVGIMVSQQKFIHTLHGHGSVCSSLSQTTRLTPNAIEGFYRPHN